jgi:hypothetical protein
VRTMICACQVIVTPAIRLADCIDSATHRAERTLYELRREMGMLVKVAIPAPESAVPTVNRQVR